MQGRLNLKVNISDSEGSAELQTNHYPPAFKTQLFKMIGNKQKMAHEIIKFFPMRFGAYFEPFLGSGGVLGVLAPKNAYGSDAYKPLIEIWQTLRYHPDILKEWYASRWYQMMSGDKVDEYEKIKSSFNKSPNGADYIFLCRACYGGVVRFRMKDGYMSTPCGAHRPIHPETFANRVDLWHERVCGTTFAHTGYKEAMDRASRNDLVYCDPPYSHSQNILYGAQQFRLAELFHKIEECKARGVYVALSIDGVKKSGRYICDVPVPEGLFEQEVSVNVGRSMLRRFQMGGRTLEEEIVTDRLLLTYSLPGA
jgi:DNA adenine methylase